MPAVPSTKAIFVFILHPHGERTLACLHVLFPKSTFPEVLVRNTEFIGEMRGYSITYGRVTTSNSAFDIFLFKVSSQLWHFHDSFFGLLLPQGIQPSWTYWFLPPPLPHVLYTHLFIILSNLAMPELLLINVHSQLHQRAQQNSVLLCLDSILAQ